MSSHSYSMHKKSEGEGPWTEGTMMVRPWAGGQERARRGQWKGEHSYTLNNKDF